MMCADRLTIDRLTTVRKWRFNSDLHALFIYLHLSPFMLYNQHRRGNFYYGKRAEFEAK